VSTQRYKFPRQRNGRSSPPIELLSLSFFKDTVAKKIIIDLPFGCILVSSWSSIWLYPTNNTVSHIVSQRCGNWCEKSLRTNVRSKQQLQTLVATRHSRIVPDFDSLITTRFWDTYHHSHYSSHYSSQTLSQISSDLFQRFRMTYLWGAMWAVISNSESSSNSQISSDLFECLIRDTHAKTHFLKFLNF